MDFTIIQALLFLTLFSANVTSCSFSSSSTGVVKFNNEKEPEAIFQAPEQRIRGMQDKRDADFVLGGLFPVHINADGRQCGQLRTQGGINRVEAMLFALDSINADPCLLANVTLGYDIRDTCFVEHIGLDEAADLIFTGSDTSTSIETDCPAANTQRGAVTSNTSTNNCMSPAPLTIGLVGAASSPVSIAIASLGRLFAMPQISYSSTSATLSDRERYTYFYRTVPSDYMEGRAIIDLVRHFGWTFISTIFSRNSYGQSGVDDVKMLAKQNGICIDLEEGIEENFGPAEYRKLVEKLMVSTADVVVLYATEQHVRGLFDELAKITVEPRHFVWIATSAWAQLVNSSSQPINPLLISGLFGFVPYFNPIGQFSSYYSKLTPNNNQRNPWISKYFENVLNCTGDCANETMPLSQSEQEYAVPLVIDAVYTYAHALQNFLSDVCENRVLEECALQDTLNGSSFLGYIKQVNFTSPTGNTIHFNNEGSVNALYKIINFQATIEKNSTEVNLTSFSFKTIGSWDGGINKSSSPLKINSMIPLQFGIDTAGELISEPIHSECRNCAPGKYLRTVQGSCCGLCDGCLGPLFSNSSRARECFNCSLYGEMWGNNSTMGSTGCVEIPKSYLHFSHPFAIVISIASVLGLILLLLTTIILAIYWKSPVILASSRESIVLVLIGAGGSFATSFVYLSPPSIPICTLKRILLWLCFSLMYSSLLVKMTRIARIFVFQKSSLKRLVCVQTHHQVLLTLMLVAGQIVIVIFSLSFVHPLVLRDLQFSATSRDALPQIVVTCQQEPLLGLLASVLYETSLILVTVVLGTLTFKSPANFNESKTICVSAYILLCIWTMFFISYTFTLNSLQHIQTAFIALTNTLGAYTILGSVIGPRIFIVLFWKERNSRFYSRRANEGDVCASRDNISTISAGMTLDTEISPNHHHREINHHNQEISLNHSNEEINSNHHDEEINLNRCNKEINSNHDDQDLTASSVGWLESNDSQLQCNNNGALDQPQHTDCEPYLNGVL